MKKCVIFKLHQREREREREGRKREREAERIGRRERERERERERGSGRERGEKRRRDKYNGLKDQSNAQSFVDNHMVSSGWQQCVNWRWYSSEGCEPAQVCPRNCSMSTTKMLA